MTQEEIMTMIAQEHGYETWGDLNDDSYDYWKNHNTKEAMYRFAEQEREKAFNAAKELDLSKGFAIDAIHKYETYDEYKKQNPLK